MLIFFLLFALALMVTLYGRSKYRYIYDEEMKGLSPSGLTGEVLARRIFEEAGIDDIKIVKSAGLFADYYNPDHKILSLAPQHFGGSTFSGLGIAAHEAGHALQQQAGYHPLKWRISAIKATMYLTLPVVIIGGVMAVMTKAVFLLVISLFLIVLRIMQ